MIDRELQAIQDRIEGLVAYLKLKVIDKDWHGAADACMDIRDAESEIIGLKKAKELYESSLENSKYGE